MTTPMHLNIRDVDFNFNFLVFMIKPTMDGNNMLCMHVEKTTIDA